MVIFWILLTTSRMSTFNSSASLFGTGCYSLSPDPFTGSNTNYTSGALTLETCYDTCSTAADVGFFGIYSTSV